MIGNILANVSDRAIRPDNNFSVFVQVSFSYLSAGPRHHPAAFVLSLVLKVKNAGFLQLFECRLPKFQMQNLALAGKKIIFDVQPQHGFQMPPQDRRRNQLRNLSRFVAALL